ncbi:MAG: PIG-L family deacetylase [Prevotella sp.]|uniref:PIG-L deacetylase family protein n=1 Tax=Mediterraneibacter sp. NSJ-151 TaxID=2897708 RepID=UPI001E11AEA6|nr:PIG-L deacetylase family protein [Mediterraneibacter sp. NSJ-151]MBD9272885.1 PIG-L family deacetylase [Prevotella sp.]MCH4280608.1 PIG-L family deacetylase [Mediterraneibacter sp. NSJ-151]
MRVLVIAPHPDDEIIGVGGTIAKRAKDGDEVYVCVVTKGKSPLFNDEFIEQGRKECRKADKKLGVKETIFLDFPAVMLETVPRYEFNGKISEVVNSIKPDEVYIPHRGDMQIDHQMVVDAAMVAARPRGINYPKRVYAYETLSETGWNIPNVVNEFIPTVYEDITDTYEVKLEAMAIFESQLSVFPEARSIGAIEALAKYRGATVSVKAAEAFSLIREVK